MNAPPRSMLAPAAFTSWAMEMIWSWFSTEQGPAIMAKFPPPTLTPDTSITLSRGWNFRLALLKGSDTRLTVSTMSSPMIRSSSSLEVSPMTPRTVVYSPLDTWVIRFWDSIQRMRSCILSSFTLGFTMMIILLSLSFPAAAGTKKACGDVFIHRRL